LPAQATELLAMPIAIRPTNIRGGLIYGDSGSLEITEGGVAGDKSRQIRGYRSSWCATTTTQYAGADNGKHEQKTPHHSTYPPRARQNLLPLQ
jgi:hypothetical protein